MGVSGEGDEAGWVYCWYGMVARLWVILWNINRLDLMQRISKESQSNLSIKAEILVPRQ